MVLTNLEKASSNNDRIVVIFGVNTSRVDQEQEIFQISSVYNNYGFNAYVCPKKGISYEVSKLTGFTVYDEKLYWHKRKIGTSTLIFALEKFLVFLKIFGKPVVLASYGGNRKDSLVISKAMKDYGFWKKFSSVVQGFTEILPIVKDKLPGRKHYKLEAVALDILDIDINLTLNNVNYDIRTLQKLIQRLRITDEEIIKSSFSLSVVRHEINAMNASRIDKISLAFLKSIIPNQMIEKLAKGGINYIKLRQAFKSNNKKGVQLLLTGWTEGQPKVTDDRETITKINNMMKLLSRTGNNKYSNNKNVSFKNGNF